MLNVANTMYRCQHTQEEEWALFRSIVSQTNDVHVVSSDIMFTQTGRTHRKWTAVSFTPGDKYEHVPPLLVKEWQGKRKRESERGRVVISIFSSFQIMRLSFKLTTLKLTIFRNMNYYIIDCMIWLLYAWALTSSVYLHLQLCKKMILKKLRRAEGVALICQEVH